MPHPLIDRFRETWPEGFPGPDLDEWSGKVFRWNTTQNRRANGEIPEGAFIAGRPTILLKGPFLDWAEEFLLRRALAATSSGPRRNRRRAEAEARKAAIEDPVIGDEVPSEEPPRISRRRSAKTAPRAVEAASS